MVPWIPFAGVIMVCVGMSAVFAAYICMLWYANSRVQVQPSTAAVVRTAAEVKQAHGLSVAELERLPGYFKDGGAVEGTECAVCLDDIEMGQSARVLPECCHAFHRRCADAWLSNNAVCPLCRTAPVPPPPV